MAGNGEEGQEEDTKLHASTLQVQGENILDGLGQNKYTLYVHFRFPDPT